MKTATFQATIWEYYHTHKRHDLPWRVVDAAGNLDPYHVMVSELMLQQTQVARVIPKYEAFLRQYSNLQALATAELGAVLQAWSGLGYNRRAKYLWQAANMIVSQYDGAFPATERSLIALPGIGKNTAGAILAYAYNQPVAYIETNIRSVYLHHFFANQVGVSDTKVLVKVSETLDVEHPREWYWALMDYGTHLKKTVGNPSVRSTAYTRQPAFNGSRREIRGQVIRHLTGVNASLAALQYAINDERLESVVTDLLSEGMINLSGDQYRL